MWIIQPLQIEQDGKPSGKWRLTARSDEDGGGPYGLCAHDHATADEAERCEAAQTRRISVTGMMEVRDRIPALEKMGPALLYGYLIEAPNVVLSVVTSASEGDFSQVMANWLCADFEKNESAAALQAAIESAGYQGVVAVFTRKHVIEL